MLRRLLSSTTWNLSKRVLSSSSTVSGVRTSEFVTASSPSHLPWASEKASFTLPSPMPTTPVQFDATNNQAKVEEYPVRNDWTVEDITEIYNHPLLDLMYHGATAHRQYFNPKEVQKCTLLSVKTGGCVEDCKYCSQSSRYNTEVKAEKLMDVEEVIEQAKKAKQGGSTRFCIGGAYRGLSQIGKGQFKRILSMISQIRSLDLEVCATFGMLTKEQALNLKDAGLTAYNHNLDTSKEFYPKVITSRVYEDRLKTLSILREIGISVCCGGIIGLGETHKDRISLLHTLSNLPVHPESVPINALVPNKGTPLEEAELVPIWDLCRMIATARILMPRSMVRLSAGRVSLSESEQALCFMSGANSIFTGDKLLTTPNPEFSQDNMMFSTLGLTGKKPFFYEQPLAKRSETEGASQVI